ncbi:hypothetical protein G6F23_013744 [Rhizopus arrhizus]|nr:hypothetical protein G6F23_013744 [Rhizopus arrhizus]
MCCRSSRLRVCAAGAIAAARAMLGSSGERPAATPACNNRRDADGARGADEGVVAAVHPCKIPLVGQIAHHQVGAHALQARGQALQVEADVGVEHGGRRQLVDVGGVQVAGAQVAAGQAEVPVRTLPVGRQHQGVLRLADHLGAVDDAQLGVAPGVAAAQP